MGAAPTSVTSIHRQGKIGAGGVRHGALILGASGDLTMGGRTKPDSSSAVSHLDPTTANALGNVRLTAPTPLAGYLTLAQQVAAAGLTPMTGDVVLDDRLWIPFNFRQQFDVRGHEEQQPRVLVRPVVRRGERRRVVVDAGRPYVRAVLPGQAGHDRDVLFCE